MLYLPYPILLGISSQSEGPQYPRGRTAQNSCGIPSNKSRFSYPEIGCSQRVFLVDWSLPAKVGVQLGALIEGLGVLPPGVQLEATSAPRPGGFVRPQARGVCSSRAPPRAPRPTPNLTLILYPHFPRSSINFRDLAKIRDKSWRSMDIRNRHEPCRRDRSLAKRAPCRLVTPRQSTGPLRVVIRPRSWTSERIETVLTWE